MIFHFPVLKSQRPVALPKFYANQQALMYRLATCFPGAETAQTRGDELPAEHKPSAEAAELGLTSDDGVGVLYDRDVVDFYGDPAWEVRMAPTKAAWEQSLVEKEGRYTFEVHFNTLRPADCVAMILRHGDDFRSIGDCDPAPSSRSAASCRADLPADS
jgi:hypothetical protein